MSSSETRKIHQVINSAGKVVGAIPDVPEQKMVEWYQWMVLGRVYSDQMVALQRQGRMGTFAAGNGQEATAVGLAAPLQKEDWLVASYRENLSHFVKGVSIIPLMKQWGGHIADDYPPELNSLPFQVVLGTQMLHAVGIAQAIKYSGKPQVVVTSCGDGASSEGDFNEALNFAGVFKAPVIFVVQNNGWAISTPRKQQTAAESIAGRGRGFGVPGYVVDGNDLLAVYQVVSDAVARARAGDGPTLIEAITYRLTAHTTADDPTKYRSDSEVGPWLKRDPLLRYRKFLMNRNLLTKLEDQRIYQEAEARMLAAVETYEALAPQQPGMLFNLVYDKPSAQLKRQKQALLRDLQSQPGFDKITPFHAPAPLQTAA